MDQRGTGSSGAISCPALQQGRGSYVQAVAACAASLGPTANAYGTGAVADDMHAILHGLGIAQVDVYGDSYGTYAAQSFALRHPIDVRSLVLDGTFDQSFDPFERESSAALRQAWTALCLRAGSCTHILRRIGAYSRRLLARPLTGIGYDQDGYRYNIKLTLVGFASLVADATYVYTIFRDLPAALDAVDRGDPGPMLRLAAEDRSINAAGGSPSSYSVGDYMAVSCHDYATIWDANSPVLTRRAQLRSAIAALAPNAFSPFSNSLWLHSPIEHQLVEGCLYWPAPTIFDPALPAGRARPSIPVLVMNGEFDQATPPADARAAAQAWPMSTYVQVPNTAHISALADFQGCSSSIVRGFVQTLAVADTSCVASMPAVNVVPSFADAVGTPERRAAWAATWTLGDALSRWYNLMYSSRGRVLDGGYFLVGGSYYSHSPLRLTFHGASFVAGYSVSGAANWNRRGLRVIAHLNVGGSAGVSGALTISFATNSSKAKAVIDGVLDGRRVYLVTAAPWSPQG
jgi:pimeloyl-ACP methyl ester carboxylesterase